MLSNVCYVTFDQIGTLTFCVALWLSSYPNSSLLVPLCQLTGALKWMEPIRIYKTTNYMSILIMVTRIFYGKITFINCIVRTKRYSCKEILLVVTGSIRVRPLMMVPPF